MQDQAIITTHDVDELFIFTVIRLIQRRAFPNLRNIIDKTHSVDIARWFPRLRAEAKASLFKVLIEEKWVFFDRVRIDLAVATGLFVTTAIDVVGIFAYFFLAKMSLFSRGAGQWLQSWWLKASRLTKP